MTGATLRFASRTRRRLLLAGKTSMGKTSLLLLWSEASFAAAGQAALLLGQTVNSPHLREPLAGTGYRLPDELLHTGQAFAELAVYAMLLGELLSHFVLFFSLSRAFRSALGEVLRCGRQKRVGPSAGEPPAPGPEPGMGGARSLEPLTLHSLADPRRPGPAAGRRVGLRQSPPPREILPVQSV